MTRTTRFSVLTLQLLVAAWLGTVGCSSSNNPATAASGASGSGTGGSTGASVAGTSTTAGSTAAGGTVASSTAAAGASTLGDASTGTYQPACGTTGAGTAIAKGVACATTDTQLCYKTCGPMNVGFKSETCSGGLYVEGSCEFPAGVNYSCFKVPTADSPNCPSTEPQHNQACSLTLCSLPCTGTACEMCGVAAGYLDSSGNQKTGYCVCIAGSSGGKWSCAAATAWPCPAGEGC
jgi:hypothetical protein